MSLLIHHNYWHHDEAGHASHSRACLDSLKKLRGIYEVSEDDKLLAQDIEVISVAAEHGTGGFESRPDLTIAHAVHEEDGDEDSTERHQVWSRLSVPKLTTESTVWEVCEGRIQCVRVHSNIQEDVLVGDLFDLALLRKVRGSTVFPNYM